jgi:hypothetical protein
VHGSIGVILPRMWLLFVATSIAAPGQASWVYPGAQVLDAGEGWVGVAGFALPIIGVGGGPVGMVAATNELAFQVGIVGGVGGFDDSVSVAAVTARWVPLDERHVRLGLMGGVARATAESEGTALAMTGVVLDAGGDHFRFDASIPFAMTQWRGEDEYVLAPFQSAETVPAIGFTHRFDEHHAVRLGGILPTLTYQYASQRFFLDAGVVVIAPLVRTGWRF